MQSPQTPNSTRVMDVNKTINKHRAAKYCKQHYGTSPSALRSWANKGILECVRTPVSGKRLYDTVQLEQLIGCHTSKTDMSESIIYARVSSSKQSDDLRRQIEELQEAYPGYRVITDVASGINFKRPGLRSLLDAVNRGNIKEIVVMHRDRLARFAIDLLEFIFRQQGVEFVVHRKNKDEQGSESPVQLAEDLMAITTVFVASHNGKRAAEGRKRRKRKREETTKRGSIDHEENIQITQDSQDQSLS